MKTMMLCTIGIVAICLIAVVAVDALEGSCVSNVKVKYRPILQRCMYANNSFDKVMCTTKAKFDMVNEFRDVCEDRFPGRLEPFPITINGIGLNAPINPNETTAPENFVIENIT